MPAVTSAESAESSVPRRLLAVATRLFAEKGFDRTSVQEIVDAADVTKGAMYHYFDSKDDLLAEIYARVLRLQMSRLSEIARQEGPVAERVERAAADVVVSTIDNLDDATISFRSLHQLRPEKQREVRDERRRYHELFRSLIVEGQDRGAFTARVPADIVVDFYFGSVHHLSTWYHPEGALSPREIGAYYARLLLDALRPAPAGR
ncbi:TetR/AcrR family transcriptional regulator [Streptomonospora wellingtoniae]|uniref:TetR/AcrR family transcriptional regulator n=1 Tax=Streptomonospora wellingtoniae TaxID=3075544 RepID=A0ABU2KX93_9ACTN|nr:TetR/AcrR family transcriptional regulator [Streptomonospora sp. DSM 45055]MDT0303873.1 TetR/AcrR family transcriptional regulator [Streptomonospora sp. DSM 45055]